jgi:hypothetical protein
MGRRVRIQMRKTPKTQPHCVVSWWVGNMLEYGGGERR